MKPVVIIGRGQLPFGSPRFDLDGKEVWGLNAGAMRDKRKYDVVFQMHTPKKFFMGNEEKEFREQYYKWLKELTIPVYMREKMDEYPTSIKYPFEEVFDMTKHIKQGVYKFSKLEFLTSSVSMEIALAILQGRERIDVYGVELERGTEYERQRDGYCFWIGFAGGRGIELNIYCGDGIFKKPIYGS